MLIINSIANREAIELVAEKVLNALTQPIDLGDGRVAKVGISMGIVLHDHSGTDPARLIERADRVMYAIKNSGKHGFRIDDSNGDYRNPNL